MIQSRSIGTAFLLPYVLSGCAKNLISPAPLLNQNVKNNSLQSREASER